MADAPDPPRPDPLADPAALADLAARAAEAGGAAALGHFRHPALVSDNKDGGGGFDPVTRADREGERAIRALIERERPEDAILGEEEAPRAGRSGLTWVLDPVDGTRAFLSGVPTWGVLVALDDGAGPRIGVVLQPFTGERFLGVAGPGGASGEARLTRAGETAPIGVRACPGLSGAVLFSTAPEMFGPAEWPAYAALRERVRLARYGIDCYAYALLAMGQIDLVVEAGLARYDIAAPAAIVRAAGGVVTGWDGGDCREGGRVVAAGDVRVHEAALKVLSRA
jgi:myo-inositol-1(or 4)-monophosphatase